MTSYPSMLRRAALIAAIGGIVATSTVLAGTTVGSALQLGIANSLSSNGSTINSTRLTGAINGDQLSLSNTSASSVAKAVAALSRSATSATARFENTGGGPALSLVVPSGKSPLYVSPGAGKATNLNADKVDGFDSTQLAKGTNVTTVMNRVVVATGTKNALLLRLPVGLGRLEVECDEGSAFTFVDYWNDQQPAAVDLWSSHHAADSEMYVGFLNADYGKAVVTSHDGIQDGGRIHIGVGAGSARRMATVEIAAFRSGADAPCGVQATAHVWTTP